MEFPFFQEMSGLSPFQWLLFVLFLALAVVIIVALVRKQQPSKKAALPAPPRHSSVLVHGALCIALSFVLSYVRIFKLPQGGTITLASMLPIMLYAHWYGAKHGFVAAFVYSLLQFMQDPYYFNFAQFLLDYILGFTAIGLSSLFPKRLLLGVLAGGLGRLLCSFLSGVIFFGSYAPEGIHPALYSLLYQLGTIGLDSLVCLFVALLLVRTRVIDRLRPPASKTH